MNQLYIEHPNQNRIRQLDLGAEHQSEMIIEVSVSATGHQQSGYSRIELERLATRLLRDHLAGD